MTLLDPLLPAKPWYRSRAVIGALVSILALVCALCGLEVDKASLTNWILDAVPVIEEACRIIWPGSC